MGVTGTCRPGRRWAMLAALSAVALLMVLPAALRGRTPPHVAPASAPDHGTADFAARMDAQIAAGLADIATRSLEQHVEHVFDEQVRTGTRSFSARSSLPTWTPGLEL